MGKINTSNTDLYILGAGGHAKVVIETSIQCGFNPVAVFDDDEQLIGTNVSQVPVIGRISSLSLPESGLAFIAIGSNRVRNILHEKFTCLRWATLIHPSAYVCKTASIGTGSLVCAGAVIQPDTVIGRHAIINTGANIDHDCRIGNFAHICPGSNLAGGVTIGEGSMIGIGSSLIPLKSVGAWSIVGAGTVVIDDIPEKSKAVGVPARIVEKLE